MYLPAFHYLNVSTGQLKCDGTGAETKFRLSAKRTSTFKSARGEGDQFSRLLAAEVCASAVVMLDTTCCDVVWRVLATHSIRHFPLHFPYPCVTVYHHISTGLYQDGCNRCSVGGDNKYAVTSWLAFVPDDGVDRISGYWTFDHQLLTGHCRNWRHRPHVRQSCQQNNMAMWHTTWSR